MRNLTKILLILTMGVFFAGCSTTMGQGKQYLRLVSDDIYTGAEMTRDGTAKAIPTLEQAYANSQQFTRDQLAQRLSQGLISQQDYNDTIKDLDAEWINYQKALGTVKQVPPTMNEMLYGLGVDPGPKRPKSLQDTLIPLGAGAAAGLGIGAAL